VLKCSLWDIALEVLFDLLVPLVIRLKSPLALPLELLNHQLVLLLYVVPCSTLPLLLLNGVEVGVLEAVRVLLFLHLCLFECVPLNHWDLLLLFVLMFFHHLLNFMLLLEGTLGSRVYAALVHRSRGSTDLAFFQFARETDATTVLAAFIFYKVKPFLVAAHQPGLLLRNFLFPFGNSSFSFIQLLLPLVKFFFFSFDHQVVVLEPSLSHLETDLGQVKQVIHRGSLLLVDLEHPSDHPLELLGIPLGQPFKFASFNFHCKR